MFTLHLLMPKEFQMRKRTEFENVLRMKRHDAGVWYVPVICSGGIYCSRIAYALWEEKQNEIKRARSIMERFAFFPMNRGPLTFASF